jgi:hypothetical protein
MFCPSCGSEERQRSQYCRACGTDLRVVRVSLERPDAVTASAISAREQIGQAVAEKIRETETARDLQRVAEDVLPQIEKFLESPEEKRLRRMRNGVVTAAVGLGATLLGIIISLAEKNFFPVIGAGLVAFCIGLGILLNGLLLTIPRKELADRSADANAQDLLDRSQGTPIVEASAVENARALPLSSVTEHTTQQLKTKR